MSSEIEEKKRDAKEIEAAEEEPKKLPYPKQVWFIVGNEFCERFSYYGMKAVLAIYLKSKLGFSEDSSTVIYHAFSGLCYFTPIFGAMLADQFFGKFKTIFWISLIYVLGHLLKTLASVTPLGLPPVEFSLTGLLLIALGTGGIKPCVAAFGGDQFKLPEQERQLQTFFSVFYFSINAGSLISTFITPIFRQDIQCFGDDTCYSLAFGVPAVLMLIATGILVMGKSQYIHKPPQGSVLTKVFGSIWYATKKRIQSSSSEKPEHWLDHAKGKYSAQLIADTKILLKLLVLYLPLPIYWALFDQQGSRWTFQATRMNGQIGSWIIKPDQMQLLNPAFILILIPTFDRLVYPFLNKFNILKKPLQRIVTGGMFTATAFFISGFLELELSKTYGLVPQTGESHAHVMNLLPCDLSVRISNQSGNYNNHFDISAGLNSIVYDLEQGAYNIEVRANGDCPIKSKVMTLPFVAQDKTVSGFLIRSIDEKLNVVSIREAEEPHKRDDAAPKFKVVFNAIQSNEAQKLIIRPAGIEPGSENDIHIIDAETEASYEGISVTPYGKLDPGSYDFYSNGKKIASEIILFQGGVHTFVVSDSTEEPKLLDFLLTKENSVHMLWLIPQFFVITVGEILFSITALEFSYSQAPASMKSVLQAVNLLTVAFGNVIVIIVAEAKAFEQASELFFFGCLMVADMALLGFLSLRFTYVKIEDTLEGAADENSEASGNNNANNIPLEEKKQSKDD